MVYMDTVNNSNMTRHVRICVVHNNLGVVHHFHGCPKHTMGEGVSHHACLKKRESDNKVHAHNHFLEAQKSW